MLHMSTENPTIYIENRVERSWQSPLADAQKLLDMPDATAEQIVEKLNAAFNNEDGSDVSLADRFDYPEDDDQFMEERVTGQRADVIPA